MKHIDILEVTSAELVGIETGLATFAARWTEIPSLKHMGIEFSGAGGAADISALDYVIYEDLYSLFFKRQFDFFEFAAQAFGNCMCRLLKFRWCAFDLSCGRILGIFHEENRLRLPLEPLIIAKLSGRPQYESFSELMLDIYFMVQDWPVGSHCLVEAAWQLEAAEFEKIWGFTVPTDILAKWQLANWVDSERLLRVVGIDAFDWSVAPRWNRIRASLTGLDREFTEYYGPGWREWAQSRQREAMLRSQ